MRKPKGRSRGFGKPRLAMCLGFAVAEDPGDATTAETGGANLADSKPLDGMA